MKIRWLVVSLALVVSLRAAESVSPTSEIPIELFQDRSRSITPGLMLYGLEWLSSTSDTREVFGAPTAILAISPTSTAYYYGKGHILIFENDELKEVVISHMPNFGVLGERVKDHPFFDPDKTRLEPGLKFFMTLDDAQQVLEGKIDQLSIDQPWKKEATYLENYAVITLGFAQSMAPHHIKPGERTGWILSSIGIRMQ